MRSFLNLISNIRQLDGVSRALSQIALQCLVLFFVSNIALLIFSIAKARGYVSFNVGRIGAVVTLSLVFTIVFFVTAYLLS